MTDADPEFLEVDDVFELHAESIARYGGDRGVRDQGLIESAIAVPRQSKTLDKAGLAQVFEECSQVSADE